MDWNMACIICLELDIEEYVRQMFSQATTDVIINDIYQRLG